MTAVLRALRFHSADTALLHSLSGSDQQKLLAFTDRTQLTLALGQRWGTELPQWLADAISERLRKNALRCEKLLAVYREIAEPLHSAGLSFSVLKGFSAIPDFCPDIRWRVQYDIDLLLSLHEAERARDLLIPLGYEPHRSGDTTPTDHLPTLVRKEPWRWRGDYFALDLPVSIDLHFRLWDEGTEAVKVPGLAEFTGRVETRTLDGLSYKALCLPDALAYAALHMLRHLLRGSLRPSHAWETGWFLQNASAKPDFWVRWKHLHPPELRRLQALCFSLVHRWYGCELAPEVQDEATALPSAVREWTDQFGWSPIYGLHRPNKDEIWLHLALIADAASRMRILRRRLLPTRFPGHVSGTYLSAPEVTTRILIRAYVQRAVHVLARAGHHLRAMISFAAGTVRWKTGLSAPFWWYFFAAAGFDIGLFTSFLLYNIYLLQIGHTERLLGYVSGAMTTGSLVGSLLTALVLRRFDIRATLVFTLTALAVVTALRAMVTAGPMLISLAALSGAATSVWAVCIAPTIAALTAESRRPRAFSLIFAAGISLGIAGGFVGGNLPYLLMQVVGSKTAALRSALLLSCVPILIAASVLLRLPAIPGGGETRSPFCVTPFLWRYLAAIVVWHLGTGSFNPFFSAFFVRLGYGVSQIGAVFSFSQAVQTLAILSAPFVLRRLGLTRGIAATQAATAIFLLSLALTTNSVTLVGAYAAYMAFQYMSEPGLNTLLMDSVKPAERGGASALTFAVAFGAQAVASSVAGVVISRFGYAELLYAASMLCVAAAAAFLFLGRRTAPSDTSGQQRASETDPPYTRSATPDERSV